MKIKEDRGHLLRWVMVILFAFYFSLLTSSAQDDDKSTMFNPVEHAVISQTIAPDARGADRKSTRLNSSHIQKSRMPSSA